MMDIAVRKKRINRWSDAASPPAPQRVSETARKTGRAV